MALPADEQSLEDLKGRDEEAREQNRKRGARRSDRGTSWQL